MPETAPLTTVASPVAAAGWRAGSHCRVAHEFRTKSVDSAGPCALTYNQMVVDSALNTARTEDPVDRIFRALGDATRRDIIRRTLAGEATVSQLAAAYDMSFAAVQKHVAVLEGAGLVSKHPHGRERLVRGNPDAIQRAQSLLDSYEEIWRGRIARLDALLAADDA